MGNLRTIRKLMSVEKRDRDLSWLMDSLQNAIALEFSTIPPYLCAWWSIKDPYDPVAVSLKTIWKEEMRHMGLACNLLAGIGGRPVLKSTVSYPGFLPGDVHPGLVVNLQGLSFDALHLFMKIEYPEFGPVAMARAKSLSYPTIGAFYSAVLKAFQELNPAIDESKQLKASPGIFKVRNLADVATAIEQIKREGEGSNASPSDTSPTDLAHYYRFGEMFYGKQIKYNEATKEWHFNGDSVSIPDAWPMVPTPPGGYLRSEVSAPVWELLEQFDTTFVAVLDHLHLAWNSPDPDPGEVDNAEDAMRELSKPAVQLMTMELPTRTGNYGPCFRLPSVRRRANAHGQSSN
jgi:hypothetical protein